MVNRQPVFIVFVQPPQKELRCRKPTQAKKVKKKKKKLFSRETNWDYEDKNFNSTLHSTSDHLFQMPGGPVIDEEGLAVQSTGEPIEPLGQERKKIAMSQKEDPNGDHFLCLPIGLLE